MALLPHPLEERLRVRPVRPALPDGAVEPQRRRPGPPGPPPPPAGARRRARRVVRQGHGVDVFGGDDAGARHVCEGAAVQREAQRRGLRVGRHADDGRAGAARGGGAGKDQVDADREEVRTGGGADEAFEVGSGPVDAQAADEQRDGVVGRRAGGGARAERAELGGLGAAAQRAVAGARTTGQARLEGLELRRGEAGEWAVPAGLRRVQREVLVVAAVARVAL